MTKNYGYSDELESDVLDGTEYKFGALSREPLFLIPIDRREPFLPKGEVQKGKEDMADCATRGPINVLETYFTYGYKNKLISEGNRKWLSDKGYADEQGNVTFSDAFNAILSNTSRQGNSMKAPIHSMYDHGLVPKKLLPLLKEMTWEEYHDKKRITQELLDLGLAFKKRLPIRYEQVDTTYLEELNKREMIVVAGYAWSKPVNGVYPRTDNRHNHVWVNIKPKYYAFDNYIDRTDGDFIKLLAPDYSIRNYGYRIFPIGDNPNVTDNWYSISALEKIVAKLKDIVALLTTTQTVKPLPLITNNTMSTKQELLLAAAIAHLGKDASPRDRADDEVACAESFCEIIKQLYPDFPMELSTTKLCSILKRDPRFKITLDLDPGNIIISPTGSGNGTVVGHVGIIGHNGVIMSNTSKSGLFEENYTIKTWVERWRNKGKMPIYVFKPL